MVSQIIKYLRKVDIFQTLIYKINSVCQGKIIFNKKSYVSTKNSSRIVVEDGRLIINAKWDSNDPFPTYISLGERSKFIINGNYKIHTGNRINIRDDAILSVGTGFLNYNCTIECSESISIGSNVKIAPNVSIFDSDFHKILPSNGKTQPIEIQDNVWVGMNSTILKGVCIGEGSIIAAGSVVNRDVPRRSMVAGVPAKVIKKEVRWE